MNILYLIFLIMWLPNNETSIECKVEVNTKVIVPTCPSNEDFDVFKIETACKLTYSKTTIYNKWNNIVFEEVNSNDGFEGKYKNGDLPDGIYDYVIEYELKGQKGISLLTGKLKIRR